MTDNADSAKGLEELVGHPGDRWESLAAAVQDDATTEFAVVQQDWLDLMWCLDAYRRNEIVPRGMGKITVSPGKRLAAVYRTKGNWYAQLVALLLGNQTSQRLAPRSHVEGFSQNHQIDVAWPDRVKPIQDAQICVETKVTGAPGYGDTGARGAMSDWSNRRKELKFAATDLKLYRRGSATDISHWDVWRNDAKPKCFFLWGARINTRKGTGDSLPKMIQEVQALVNTYLDGAGIFAWREGSSETCYEAVKVTDPSQRVLTIDDVLHRVANEIRNLAPGGKVPPPQVPANRVVDTAALIDDNDDLT